MIIFVVVIVIILIPTAFRVCLRGVCGWGSRCCTGTLLLVALLEE